MRPAHRGDEEPRLDVLRAVRAFRSASTTTWLPAFGLLGSLLYLGWIGRGHVSPATLRVWVLGSVLVSLLRLAVAFSDDEQGDAPIVIANGAAYGLWISWYWMTLAPLDDPIGLGLAFITVTIWWTGSASNLAADPIAFSVQSALLTISPLIIAMVQGTAFGSRVWMILFVAASIVGTFLDRRRTFIESRDARAATEALAFEVQLAFNSARDGVLVTRAGRVTRTNIAVRRLLRRDGDDLIGRFLGEIFGPDHDLTPGPATEIAITRQDGSGRTVEITGRGHPEADLVVWQLRDITDQVQRVRALMNQVESDELTGVANRRVMIDLLSRALDHRRPVSVLLVDVDNFKKINDRFGHAVGDRVLQGTVDRMVAAVGADGVVTRVGGDEFIVIVSDLDAVERRGEIADRIVEASREPLVVTSEPLIVTISIGVGYTDGLRSMSPEQLIEIADRAMYRVKQDGRAGWRDASEETLTH